MLAAVQAPIIMMSQNRAADRDRLAAEVDHEVNVRAELSVRDIDRRLHRIERHLGALARLPTPCPRPTWDRRPRELAHATPGRTNPGSARQTGPTRVQRVLRVLRAVWPPLVLALVGYLGWRDLRGLDLHALHTITRSLSNLDLLGLQLLALVPVLAMCGYDLLLNRWLRHPSADPAGAALRLAGLHPGQPGRPVGHDRQRRALPGPVARGGRRAHHRRLRRPAIAGGAAGTGPAVRGGAGGLAASCDCPAAAPRRTAAAAGRLRGVRAGVLPAHRQRRPAPALFSRTAATDRRPAPEADHRLVRRMGPRAGGAGRGTGAGRRAARTRSNCCWPSRWPPPPASPVRCRAALACWTAPCW